MTVVNQSRPNGILVAVKLAQHLLLLIAHFLKWFANFVLNFVLNCITILEAVVFVFLQLLKILRDTIKVIVTFGSLLYFIGHDFGAFGTFFLILGLVTYYFWPESNINTQTLVSSSNLIIIRIVFIGIWVLVAAILFIVVLIYLKRATKKIITNFHKDHLPETHCRECRGGVERIRYIIDKASETNPDDYRIENDQNTDDIEKSRRGMTGADVSGEGDPDNGDLMVATNEESDRSDRYPSSVSTERQRDSSIQLQGRPRGKVRRENQTESNDENDQEAQEGVDPQNEATDMDRTEGSSDNGNTRTVEHRRNESDYSDEHEEMEDSERKGLSAGQQEDSSSSLDRRRRTRRRGRKESDSASEGENVSSEKERRGRGRGKGQGRVKEKA